MISSLPEIEVKNMLDTIINIIQWGHFIGLLVLIFLYFTTPYILRTYVFTVDEESNNEKNNEKNNEENYEFKN